MSAIQLSLRAPVAIGASIAAFNEAPTTAADAYVGDFVVQLASEGVYYHSALKVDEAAESEYLSSPAPEKAEEWNNSKERRFSDLVTAKALRTASEQDLADLSALAIRRRRAKETLSAEDIVFEFKRKQWAAALEKQVAGFLNFTNAANRSKRNG